MAFVEDATAARARDVAHRVATRLCDRERLLQVNRSAARQSRYPDTLRWRPYAIAHGDAGLALAHGYFDRCFPGEGWDRTASTFLQEALNAARVSQLLPGLQGGLAGLAFAVRSQPCSSPLRQAHLGLLDHALAPRVLEISAGLYARHGVAVSEFDSISGLAGIGAYLLASDFSPPVDVVWHALLEALIAMTTTSIDEEPHWYTPAHLMGDEGMKMSYPAGNCNFGLAHGIPGPLALMALALLHPPAQVEEPKGLAEAVRRCADWIVSQRSSDEFGVQWPTVVHRSADDRARAHPPGSRAAWCYGGPGVARALWLAGRALDDFTLCELAIETMTAVYKRPVALRQIDSPTFCHGAAGLLQITLRFAEDTRLPIFREAAETLCQQLLTAYRDDSPLGFRSIEPGGYEVDQCGLLDGAAGVAMVLLTAAGGPAPDWDRVFLLS